MSGFSSAWLTLREPYDRAARNETLLTQLLEYISAHHTPAIVDLGAGTGSNLRFLAPAITQPQRWWLIENDEPLLRTLEALTPMTGHDAVRATVVALDLAHELEKLPLSQASLLTASALLDLVSDHWAQRLAMGCRTANVATVYFTLTFDGSIDWSPSHALDNAVRTALCAHQRRDKGFGAALGPDATTYIRSAFETNGYDSAARRSDWQFNGEDSEIQTTLLADWTAACTEMSTPKGSDLRAWNTFRQNCIDAGRSQLRVGHLDLLLRLR